NGLWHERYTTEGEDQITVSGAAITAVRIQRLREGRLGNGVGYSGKTTYWLDRGNGMLVKVEYEHLSGKPARIQPFQVTRFVEPEA
ncbi:hypothetical protein D9599_30535, partial [Roseomonas sp. KE2513]|uniref:outer membrane lipoprotein-sorting protein n=1 Tax=Roseomonas sp. KE2513 TaxID=2479202 RepID=UPI001E3BC9C2